MQRQLPSHCRRPAVLTSVSALLLTLALAVGIRGVRAEAPVHQAAVQPSAQDVFVIVGSTLRNPDETTAPSAGLFNVDGVSLGLTWGDWTRATATATAHSIGNERTARTDVDLQLQGLVPGGVYSVFYATTAPDSENPHCPHVERFLAVQSQHPGQQPDSASFVAGATGQAHFVGRVDGHLLDAGQVYFELIYHFDGQTYGMLPNHGEANTQGPACHSSFGEDAMRQLIISMKP